MSSEFEWPPADEALERQILWLDTERGVEELEPRDDPGVTFENPRLPGSGSVAITQAEPPQVTQVVAVIVPLTVELTLDDWPQEASPAIASREVAAHHVPAIDPTPTGPSLSDPPRPHQLPAFRPRYRLRSHAAAVAASIVCAAVATSYVGREALKVTVEAPRQPKGQEPTGSANVIQPPPSDAKVTTGASAAALLESAAPRPEQLEPAQLPDASQPRKLDVPPARPDLTRQSASSRADPGSASPRATPSRLEAIATGASGIAVTDQSVVPNNNSARAVDSEQRSTRTTPEIAVGSGGVGEATAQSVPTAPPASVFVLPTVAAPVPVPAAPARDVLAATASSTSAALTSPTGRTASNVPTGVQEEQDIRRVLQRYALAYEQLDANAAKVVWPTVDVRALSRAFEGLESQDLTFSGCELSIGGAKAQAICHGTATYVPKIGSKDPRTVRRDWIFTLNKLEKGWTISETR